MKSLLYVPALDGRVRLYLSPFLLGLAACCGLAATIPLFVLPVAFALWLKTAIALVLVLFLLAALLLVFLRKGRERHRFGMDPGRLVKLDGMGFLLWFLLHNLFWVAFGGLGIMTLLVLFGPDTWVVVFAAGLIACMSFALCGTWSLRRTETLGLCWHAGSPAEIDGFFARAEAAFLLRKRYAYAVRQDLAKPRSLLRDITRTLDLDRVGGADRRIDLWSNGFARAASEFGLRFKILAVLFSVTCLLCLLLLLLLPRLDLPPNLQAWARAGSVERPQTPAGDRAAEVHIDQSPAAKTRDEYTSKDGRNQGAEVQADPSPTDTETRGDDQNPRPDDRGARQNDPAADRRDDSPSENRPETQDPSTDGDRHSVRAEGGDRNESAQNPPDENGKVKRGDAAASSSEASRQGGEKNSDRESSGSSQPSQGEEAGRHGNQGQQTGDANSDASRQGGNKKGPQDRDTSAETQPGQGGKSRQRGSQADQSGESQTGKDEQTGSKGSGSDPSGQAPSGRDEEGRKDGTQGQPAGGESQQGQSGQKSQQGQKGGSQPGEGQSGKRNSQAQPSQNAQPGKGSEPGREGRGSGGESGGDQDGESSEKPTGAASSGKGDKPGQGENGKSRGKPGGQESQGNADGQESDAGRNPGDSRSRQSSGGDPRNKSKGSGKSGPVDSDIAPDEIRPGSGGPGKGQSFPPPGENELITLELPPLKERSPTSQEPELLMSKQAEEWQPAQTTLDPGRPTEGETGKPPRTPRGSRPPDNSGDAKPIQHLPNWIQVLYQRKEDP